jgi:HSP20 family protein
MSESFFDADDIFEGAKDNLGTGPHWHGYALSVGPNGRPILKEFGHKPEASRDSAREPMVDTIVDEKSNTVKLIAEIPGVEKSDIQVVVDNDAVDISAVRDNKKYHAKVPIRHNVDEKSAKASSTEPLEECLNPFLTRMTSLKVPRTTLEQDRTGMATP